METNRERSGKKGVVCVCVCGGRRGEEILVICLEAGLVDVLYGTIGVVDHLSASLFQSKAPDWMT